MSFRFASIIGVCVAAGVLFWRVYRNQAAQAALRKGVWPALTSTDAFLVNAKRILLAIAVLSGIGLLLSGFAQPIFKGMHMSGLFLLAHVLLAPVFAVAVAVLALFTAHQHRLMRDDAHALAGFVCRNASPHSSKRRESIGKLCFWASLVFSFLVIISMLLSFSFQLAIEKQMSLLVLHRYAALGLLLAAAGYATAALPSGPQHERPSVGAEELSG